MHLMIRNMGRSLETIGARWLEKKHDVSNFQRALMCVSQLSGLSEGVGICNCKVKSSQFPHDACNLWVMLSMFLKVKKKKRKGVPTHIAKVEAISCFFYSLKGILYHPYDT